MGDPRQPRIPRLLTGADITRLPLGPTEGFILSRIDGAASLLEIADMTGLPIGRVEEVVSRLVASEVAEWVEPFHPRARHQTHPRVTPSRGTLRTKPAPPHTSRALYDPQELEEPDVDLPVERRRQILDTFYRLEELSYYDLLGLQEDADKATIRAGYFTASKLFHPDTLFGKRLGSYKAKMEAVFRRLTEAYEALGKSRTRSEYDAYLKLRKRTQAAEMMLGEAEREAERIERETARAVDRAIYEPPAAPPPAPEPPKPSDEAAPPAPSPAPRAASPGARGRAKRLMARKIAAATGRPLPSQPAADPALPHRSSANPPVTGEPVDRDSLLRGLASSLRQVASVTGGVDHVLKYREDARQLEREGNLVAAANSLRMAVAIAPDDRALEEEYGRISGRLAASLAETYEKQASYEERAGRWADAALSWAKVCAGRPGDGHAHRRTAEALLEAGSDLAKAKAYAQRALELLPEDARARRALGRVFYAAGMTLNARRELEKAATLDPSDEMVKNLLRDMGTRT